MLVEINNYDIICQDRPLTEMGISLQNGEEFVVIDPESFAEPQLIKCNVDFYLGDYARIVDIYSKSWDRSKSYLVLDKIPKIKAG